MENKAGGETIPDIIHRFGTVSGKFEIRQMITFSLPMTKPQFEYNTDICDGYSYVYDNYTKKFIKTPVRYIWAR